MRVCCLRLGSLLGLLLMLAHVQAPAWAAGQDAQATAKARYEEAARQYDLKEYPAALDGFREAYRLSGDPVFLFNIAQCQRKLGNNQDAIDFYKSYLRRRPDAPNRDEVERRLAELEKLVAEQKPAAPAPEPSPQQIEVTPPPAAPVPQPASPVTQPAGLDLTSQAPPPEPSSTPIYRTWWFWTGAGVVVAGGVVTAILLASGKKTGAFCPDCNETAGISPQ
jgi:tetratricopeptide (TPR) repeat protein